MSRPTIAPSPAVPSQDPRTAAAAGPHSLRAALPLTVIFFLIGFFSIYILRDLVEYLASAWLTHRAGGGGYPPDPRRGDGPRGLDPAALAALPICRYSSPKGPREGECETECAVCLSEFSGDDPVRLLKACRHAFHQGCIDQWLASHATCPVCRCDLRKPPEKMAKGGGEEGQRSATEPGAALQSRGDGAGQP